MSKSSAIAETLHTNKTESTALAHVETSGAVSMFGDGMEKYAAAGLENVTAKDLLIPRLTILQALSPQLDKAKSVFMPDAKRGDICDVGLEEIMPSPMLFIPVYFKTQYLEWKPGRKGLAMIHDDPNIMSQTSLNEKRQNVMPNGNFIVETAQFYGLNVAAGYRFSFIPMAVTQLKKGRRWNTLATTEKVARRDGSGDFTPPMFYRAYLLSTVPESNAEGMSWDGWKIERGPRIEDMEGASQKVFELATGFYEQLRSGKARGDVDSMEGDVVDSTATNVTM